MTAKALARLHALAMGIPAPWSEHDFTDLLAMKSTFLCLHPSSGQKYPRDRAVQTLYAFALGRVIGDEAELLTLAVHPDQRRQGLARACLNKFETKAKSKGATRAFLEVANTNAGARTLYGTAGWTEDGIRTNYYRTANGQTDAILMSKTLNSA